MRYTWVIDLDIKGFFDNISHNILIELLGQHTQEKWVMLYVKRWLEAGVEQEAGSIAQRIKGTPQGGVISPLLANIYLHYAFDKWMGEVNPQQPFERYADDIIIHCSSKEEAELILVKLKVRMQEYELELHPNKTKIVYCKNYYRKEKHDNRSFTFLSFSFQPRTIRDKRDEKKRLLVFNAAISQQAKTNIRTHLKRLLQVKWNVATIEWFAENLNPRLRGWINYYAKFGRWKTLKLFWYLNGLILQWIKRTYKIIGIGRALKKLRRIQADKPDLFYHWQLGVK